MDQNTRNIAYPRFYNKSNDCPRPLNHHVFAEQQSLSLSFFFTPAPTGLFHFSKKGGGYGLYIPWPLVVSGTYTDTVFEGDPVLSTWVPFPDNAFSNKEGLLYSLVEFLKTYPAVFSSV